MIDYGQRKVAQYDYFTDELIEIYPSIRLAAQDNYLREDSLCKKLAKKGGIFPKRKLKFNFV